MTPRIQKAIDIFLDAINEGTLAKGTCLACACGNLVAKSLGIKPIIHNGQDSYRNTMLHNQPNGTFWSDSIIGGSYNPRGIREIKSTGFTIEEFRDIEEAFENNTRICFSEYSNFSKEEIRKDQINGLKAVVEIMLEFDNQADNIQEVFVDKAKLIPV